MVVLLRWFSFSFFSPLSKTEKYMGDILSSTDRSSPIQAYFSITIEMMEREMTNMMNEEDGEYDSMVTIATIDVSREQCDVANLAS